jgi:serine/threonine protein phosphatase PrpC
VELLTIGGFARAAGLTAKALRLYDELGLLPPAAVDPDSGYRLYDPRQLRQARLIARLRGIGMPLAEIRTVCGLRPDAAAEAVAGYWRRVSADTADRARQAALLVEQLSGRDADVTFRFAVGCEAGLVRERNQDAAYAGAGLLAVADGGGPGGAAASAAAIEALRPLELTDGPATDVLTALADADRALRQAATGDRQSISTLTALLRRGSRLVLVHVGDTRAYLLRDGDLVRLTQDHTWVQSQVDAGKLDPNDAATHPDRALLVRALGAGEHDLEADLALRTAVPGDRYLLCSDGLSAVLDRTALHTTMTTAGDPGRTVRHLIDLAHAAGAPDNIACVVADFVAGAVMSQERSPGSDVGSGQGCT